MRLTIAVILTLSLFSILVTYTNINNHTANRSEYNSPPPLLIGLKNPPISKDNYIKNQLAIIKFNGRNKKSLDIIDYHLNTQNKLLNAQISLDKRKLKIVKTLLEHDLNNDASITREELKQSLISSCMIISMGQAGGMVSKKCSEKESKNTVHRNIEKILSQYDTNSDGTINKNEIVEMIKQIYSNKPDNKENDLILNKTEIIRDYLLLDTNGDEIITLKELEKLAEGTFNSYDINKDGIISKDETNPLRSINFKYNLQTRSYCGYLENGKYTCLKAHKAYDQLSPKNSIE